MSLNPANNYITIHNESGETLKQAEIIDLSGRIIQTISLGNIIDTPIRIDDLESGPYLLKVNATEKSCTKRFIKD